MQVKQSRTDRIIADGKYLRERYPDDFRYEKTEGIIFYTVLIAIFSLWIFSLFVH